MNLLPEDLERIHKIREFVTQNYNKHITYTSLCQQFHISERKLSGDFKKIFNQTVIEYATEVRIGKAKELLAETYKPIKVIAYLVGYHETHLNKQFKRLTGMAPINWRKMKLEVRR